MHANPVKRGPAPTASQICAGLFCDRPIILTFATRVPTRVEHAFGGLFQVMDGSAVLAAAGFLCAREERAAIRHRKILAREGRDAPRRKSVPVRFCVRTQLAPTVRSWRGVCHPVIAVILGGVGSAPGQLSGCGFTLAAIVFDVRLCCLAGILPCVLVVPPSEVRVMRRWFVFPCFVVFRGFLVVSGRMFAMFCCLVMILRCFL